jgi:hypothetical protein
MTRKHYVKIAAIINNLRTVENDELLDQLSFDLAHMFLEDNPRFDEERFYEAAGTIKR